MTYPLVFAAKLYNFPFGNGRRDCRTFWLSDLWEMPWSCEVKTRADENGASSGSQKLDFRDQKFLEISVILELQWRKAELVLKVYSCHKVFL